MFQRYFQKLCLTVQHSIWLSREHMVQTFSRYMHQPKLITMKLETPQFRAIFTPELKMLMDIFARHGHELRIAGGAVRDLLMHKQPEDIDFASTATPTIMKEMFESEGIRMLNTRGEKHGTITVRMNDKQNFEITTLRIDVITDGRHAKVEFTTDWQLDAGRRDLTINSMFLGLDGTVYDYFRGIDDLEKRKVLFVGEPAERIREDYLRILRYFRFYGRIAVQSDTHDADTLTAIRENVGGLKDISGERLWVEFKKILAGNHVKDIVRRMFDLGVSPFIGFSESPNINEFEQVCDRSLALCPQPVTLLAALLANEEQALTLNSRLKFSKYEKELLLFIVSNRVDVICDEPLKLYQKIVLRKKNRVADVQEWACELLKYKGDAALLEELRCWQLPKFPVNGHMLIARGVKSGQKFNNIMTLLRDKWVDSDFEMTAEDLLKCLPDILEGARSNGN